MKYSNLGRGVVRSARAAAVLVSLNATFAAAQSTGGTVYCVPNPTQACVRVSITTTQANGRTDVTLRLANLQGASLPGVVPAAWARLHTVEILARDGGNFQGGALDPTMTISPSGAVTEAGDGSPTWSASNLSEPGKYVGYVLFTDIQQRGAEIVGCTRPPDLDAPFFQTCGTGGAPAGDLVFRFSTAGVWSANQVGLVFGIQDDNGYTACGVDGQLWTNTDVPQCLTPLSQLMDVQPATISLTTTNTVTAYLYSTATFNATTIDPSTVSMRVNGSGLSGAPVSKRGTAFLSSVGDYNNDGRQDRLFVFLRTDLEIAGLTPQRTSLVLQGAIGAFSFEAVDPTPPAVVGPVTANGPFAAVTVSPGVPANNPGAIVNDIALAVSRVTSGGVITVLPGTYPAANVQITKALTIRADPSATQRPILDGGGAVVILNIPNLTQGAVTVQGLELRNGVGAAIAVNGGQASMLLANNVIHVSEANTYDPPLAQYATGIGVYNHTGSTVIENSSFIQGAVGVLGDAAKDLIIRGNTFQGQSNRAIQVGGSPTAKVRILNNTVTECPPIVCIAFYDGDAEVTGNTVAVDIAFPTQTVIGGGGVRSYVASNIVTGQGGTMTASSSTWAITGAAIGFYRAQNAIAVGNRITRSYQGVWFDQSNAVGNDNVIDEVHTGVGAWAVDGVNVTTFSTVTFRRNNILNYVEPMPSWIAQGVAGSTFGCNWWGASTGPANVSPNVPASLYIPFAPAPIANTAAACP